MRVPEVRAASAEMVTPARLLGDRHEAARTIVGQLHAGSPQIGASMAGRLHATIPELHAPDEQAIFDETEASCTSNVDQLLDLLSRGEPADELIVPDAALRYAQGLVRRRIPLDVLLRAYRIGHAFLWDLTARNLRDEIRRETELLDSLEASATFMFRYVDLVSAELVAAYHVERDRWVRSAAAVRAETARAIIDNEERQDVAASARLRYELRRHHVAAVLAVEPSGAGPDAVLTLEREAYAAAGACGARDVMVVPAGAAVVWAWYGSLEPPAADQLAALERHRPPDGVRLAIGRPAFGLDGFRITHLEAQQAARFWDVAAVARSTITYRSIEVVSLLAADLDRARRFVRCELGPLAEPTATAAEIRHTLMAFLACGASHTRAAQALHMHPNTVYKRVRRAEDLLPYPVSERRVELANALMLAESLGAEVLEV